MISGKPQFEFCEYGNGQFRVTCGFVAQVGRNRVFIPVGTRTNGASIPAIFRVVFDPYGRDYFLAATVHDALVGEFGDKVRVHDIVNGESKHLNWKEAAQFFRELMRVSKAPNWKCHIFYHAVMLLKRLRLRK